METIALISLGCAKNLVDSEVMVGCLNEAGYRFTENPEMGDIIIINTCGFIRPAKEEAEEHIEQALGIKKRKTGIKVVVTGCYVQRCEAALKSKFPEVDAWLGVSDFDKIVPAVKGDVFSSSGRCFLYNHLTPRFVSTPRVWAYVKISEGCSHQCSFCAIPLIKGPYISRPVSSVVSEVEKLVSDGVREVNLISQDTTYFGREGGQKGQLPLLLDQLTGIKNLEWIRLLYSYPEEITDELLEMMEHEKICSYLDIPFQHSHPDILKVMGRGMDGGRAQSLLDRIRKRLPDVSLRTTLIVGFPGETEKEFEHLLSFVEACRFDHLGVFAYSPEEGTSCFSLGDVVSEKDKEERRKSIMSVQAEISLAHNKRRLGQVIEVLVEGTLKNEPKIWIGRSRFQAPEVDGLVFIETESDISLLRNPLQNVEIREGDVYDLYGVLSS
jgi:ribosomal protein S12 methylthiotransferase